MKKGDMRRGELLAAAERLFYTKGYEGTSVQDILSATNCSKGGFYHHFDSKLSVLEAICDMRAQACCERAKAAIERAGGTAADKLNALLHDAAMITGESGGFVSLMIQVAYREDGALMRERMKARQLEGLQSVLEGVLAEGARSGEFFVGDVLAWTQMLARLYLVMTDEIAFLLAREDGEEAAMDALLCILQTYRTAIERMLIAPFGSIVLFEAKEMQLLAQEIIRRRIRERADAMLGN